MNVEIGAEAAQFPEKEYINGIAVAVHNNILHISAYTSNSAKGMKTCFISVNIGTT
jgi:hypothetical protein